MRPALTRALAAAVVVALAGCGSSTPYTPPTVVPAGPSTLPEERICPDRDGSAGTPVSIEGLQISAVVLCDLGDRRSSPYVEKRYTTDLEPTVAALGRPDQERPDGQFFCGGVEVIFRAQVIVVTADGRRVVPHLPVDACQNAEEALSALQDLNARNPDQSSVIEPAGSALEEARREAEAERQHCPVWWYDASRRFRSSDRAPAPVLPQHWIRRCTMEAEGLTTSATLRFVPDGDNYTPDAARLQKALNAIDTSASCPEPAHRGAVLAFLVGRQMSFFVEVRGDCALVWTQLGPVGVLHGADIEAFT